MKTVLISSLKKVFSAETIPHSDINALSMLKNERLCFQIVVSAKRGDKITIKLPAQLDRYIKTFYVHEIPVEYTCAHDHDDYIISDKPGDYPDALFKFDTSFEALYDGNNTIWIEFAPENALDAGEYELCFEINVKGECSREKVTVEIIDAQLPEQSLIYTNWFHCDCLATYYNVDVFSEEHWSLIDEFMSAAAEHAMNMILTPVFTPALDTKIGTERPTVQLVDIEKIGADYHFSFDKLERWISLCDKNGIKNLEICHFFSQWGAVNAPKIVVSENGESKVEFGWHTDAQSKEYADFLSQFAQAFNTFTNEKGIADRCYLHISDEPSLEQIDTYKKRSKLVKSLFPGYKIIDALSNYEFYDKGLVEIPIPANNHIEQFIGNSRELWTYYCCGQYKDYVSNRFMNMPSQRNRILGVQMYKYDVKGFLQWGYNFWYSPLSVHRLDPFKASALEEELHPAGDPFCVYPGENGSAVVSLRLKVFYDAVQDMRALQLLESKIGKDAVLEILEKGIEPISFKKYPRDDKWHLAMRERINAEIKKNL